MKKPRFVALLLVVILCWASLPGRADDKKDDVDDIGDRKVAHRSIISQEKEIAIGKQYADQIDKQAKILKDPVINEYVNRVAQNLARNSDLKIPLTIKVIDDPAINAITLPGGFMYLNTGTLLAADEEDQVAGVIAHEIGHAAAGHRASTMTKATLLQFSMIPMMFIPMTAAVYMGVMEAYMNGVPMMFLKFSRKDEQEADFLGLQYMYKAGYDPNAFVGFFGKVMDEERHSPGSMAKVFAAIRPRAIVLSPPRKRFRRFSPSGTSTWYLPPSSMTSSHGCKRSSPNTSGSKRVTRGPRCASANRPTPAPRKPVKKPIRMVTIPRPC